MLMYLCVICLCFSTFPFLAHVGHLITQPLPPGPPPPLPFFFTKKLIYNNAIAAPTTARNPQPPISTAPAEDVCDDVAAGAGAVPDGVLVAEAVPDAELLVEEPEADKTPEASVPLALALPVYAVEPTPRPLLHSPAWADDRKVMSAHWWRFISQHGGCLGRKFYIVKSTGGIAVGHHLNCGVLAIGDVQARRHDLPKRSAFKSSCVLRSHHLACVDEPHPSCKSYQAPAPATLAAG